MKKLAYHPTKLVAGIFLVLLSFIAGCKKQAQEPKIELKENISRTELINWVKVYESIIPNGPKALIEKAVKTYYKDQMIVKVPLSSGGGDLYFTKKQV